MQILVGMVIGFIYKLKHGEIASALCEEAAWWVIIGCGVALGITGKKTFLWVLLAVLIISQGYGKKASDGKLLASVVRYTITLPAILGIFSPMFA